MLLPRSSQSYTAPPSSRIPSLSQQLLHFDRLVKENDRLARELSRVQDAAALEQAQLQVSPSTDSRRMQLVAVYKTALTIVAGCCSRIKGPGIGVVAAGWPSCLFLLIVGATYSVPA